jgi:hypothetical protein
MVILGWIVFGLIVGIVAKMLMPGRDPGGFVYAASAAREFSGRIWPFLLGEASRSGRR